MTAAAILGPLGTYTHQAAVLALGTSAELLPFETIASTFEALLNRPAQIACAVLPISNSSFGPVAATSDCLSRHAHQLKQVKTVTVKIQHSLWRSATADLESPVEVIVSHEQALGQCARYIETNYPATKQQATDSTAAAAEYAQHHPKAAALCSQLAGELFKLQLVDQGPDGQGVQDAGDSNETTFGVFERSLTESR